MTIKRENFARKTALGYQKVIAWLIIVGAISCGFFSRSRSDSTGENNMADASQNSAADPGGLGHASIDTAFAAANVPYGMIGGAMWTRYSMALPFSRVLTGIGHAYSNERRRVR